MIEPTRPASGNTDALILWGYILSGLSLFCCCCPAALALPALALGIIAYWRGDQRGKWVIIAAVIALVLTGALRLTGASQRQMHRWVPPQYQGPWINT